MLHHEVGLFKLLLNINSKILNLHATKSFLWVSLHLRNHMMIPWWLVGEGDGVVVELKGVGVGQGDGEH